MKINDVYQRLTSLMIMIFGVHERTAISITRLLGKPRPNIGIRFSQRQTIGGGGGDGKVVLYSVQAV